MEDLTSTSLFENFRYFPTIWYQFHKVLPPVGVTRKIRPETAALDAADYMSVLVIWPWLPWQPLRCAYFLYRYHNQPMILQIIPKIQVSPRQNKTSFNIGQNFVKSFWTPTSGILGLFLLFSEKE